MASQYVTFMSVAFPWHGVFREHPRCSTHQNVIPFCGYFTSCLSIHWLWDIWFFSYFLPVTGRVLLNFEVQVFEWLYVNSLENAPGSGVVGWESDFLFLPLVVPPSGSRVWSSAELWKLEGGGRLGSGAGSHGLLAPACVQRSLFLLGHSRGSRKCRNVHAAFWVQRPGEAFTEARL